MPESTAETLAREFAALNTATQRAHQVLADMRAERKLLSALLIEVREATQQRAEALVETAVVREVDKMDQAVQKAIAMAEERVFARFDRLTRMITGEEGHPDRPPLEDLIREAQQRGRT
jgi:hypothetical protein